MRTAASSRFKPGEILWKSIPFDRSLAYLLEKATTRNRIDPWLDSYQNESPASTASSTTTRRSAPLVDRSRLCLRDQRSRRAAAPESVPVPVQQSADQRQIQDVKAALDAATMLCAYDLKTGKMVWDLKAATRKRTRSSRTAISSACRSRSAASCTSQRKADHRPRAEVSDRPVRPTHESDPRRIGNSPGLHRPDQGRQRRSRPSSAIRSCSAPSCSTIASCRTSRAASTPCSLAYGEGILVCPTNAGEVFGIDLMTRSLVWSYPYRESAAPDDLAADRGVSIRTSVSRARRCRKFGTTTIVSKWKSAPPAIQDGKIVFTAPDADSIHCVNLRDGKPVWKKGQSEGRSLHGRRLSRAAC